MNDTQDDFEGSWDSYSKLEKSKTSSVATDMFSVKPWTEANMNHYQTSMDSVKTRHGTSQIQQRDLKATGQTEKKPMDYTVVTEEHHGISGTAVHENGYGSSPGKQRTSMMNRDLRHQQCEYNIHPQRPQTFEAPSSVDSLPEGNGTKTESAMKYCETWERRDSHTQEQKYCNKTGNLHSEVTKIVPLKPQRSKKSLEKEYKDVNPLTQSQSDRGITDVHVTKSKDRSSVAGRRVEDKMVQLPVLDDVKENKGLIKHQSDAAMSFQQQTQRGNKQCRHPGFRDFRGPAGQCRSTRGGVPPEDHFQNDSELKEIFLCGSKVPTAPPRSLPLKTQWSRDWQSNMDNSHIHYRPPGQETSKRKQAVKHLPALFVHHWKVNHCQTLHEPRAMSIFF